MHLLVLDSFRNCTHVFLWAIEHNWKDLAEHHRIAISREDIILGLRELVKLGFLTATYKGRQGRPYDGMPPLEEITPLGAYFWVTSAGFLTTGSWLLLSASTNAAYPAAFAGCASAALECPSA